MLSRIADSLYWLGRYGERVGNTARLLDGTQRLSLLPIPPGEHDNLWRNLFQSDAEVAAFKGKHTEFVEDQVIEFLALDQDNPSSIRSCVYSARDNTRAARYVLTTEISQSINQSWIEIRDLTIEDVRERGTQDFLETVKDRSHHFTGVVYGTMRRGEPFLFWKLGKLIESAENTSRLILSRCDAFHRAARRDDGFEFYRWGTFLRSVNSYSAYRQLQGDVDPIAVASLLILSDEVPRSLLVCVDDAAGILKTLRHDAKCTKLAEQLAGDMRTLNLDRVLRSGLAGFLMEFRDRVHELSDQVRQDFIMVR